MNYINKNIAVNLRKIRSGKNMSLDQAAEQTGVSKSMLAQIERGDANPSIECLGKIISGLRVDLSEILETPHSETCHIPKADLTPTKEMPGQYLIFTYFPYDNVRPFEIYGIEISPGCTYYSGAHGEKTVEYLTVSEGTLTLVVSGREHVISEGDAFRFDSDREHLYMNRGDKPLRLTSVFTF